MGYLKKIRRNLSRYGLEISSVINIDLSTLYVQSVPNLDIRRFFINDSLLLINSPHVEICKIYFKHGAKELRKRYKNTRYYNFIKYMNKNKGESYYKIVNICKSIQRGYLRKGYEHSYIVILDCPFAQSRFKRCIGNNVPEIWSGHHRAAAMICMDNKFVKTILAVDLNPGSCYSYGKIHRWCYSENL